ncbi:MAG: methionyl-tRNA formyltransferase [Gemmatimonadota bacterium]|nr:methionyl-tRNA formyltransferase [Gemmatimonadota bacterium]
MRVLFWGTPEFATPPLRALVGEGFDVVGVVTQPDKPVGRSRSKVQAPPVKLVAEDEGIPVIQPPKPRGPEFLDSIRTLAPDVSVVVAYGHILPTLAIDVPRLGTFNIHASLLPALRGAAPIQAAIREGYERTGVTVMRVVPALDAGPIIHQVATPILDDETFGELSLRLSELGALALIEALALLAVGEVVEVGQDESRATYAPKVDREAARVDWSLDAVTVSRIVRAYDPKPGAFTRLRGADVKLFGARPAPAAGGAPGEVLEIERGVMTVKCGAGGSVRVVAVQPAGKKRMSPEDWARGRGIAVGDRFASTDDANVA